MTNKEAITVLKNHISPYDNCKADNEANQAIRLAIKALEERPQGDLISRSALKEEFKQYICSGCTFNIKDYPLTVCENCAPLKLLDIIDNAPTVEAYTKEEVQEIREEVAKEFKDIIDNAPTVEPKQGKWITGGKDVTGQYFQDEFVCNKCFAVVTDKSNFCPNCGAKMDMGGKEDVFTRKEELSKEESEWLIDFITKDGDTE